MNPLELENIGLTPGESKVYLALLHLGTISAGPIAKEAQVARSKLYEILDRLSKKGIVSHAVKNNTKYFSAAHPSRIMDFLRRKEEDVKQQQQKIAFLVPQLETEYEMQEVKQEAQVFEGLEGLKNMREEALRTMKKGDRIYFIGVPASAYIHMQPYYTAWNQRRMRKGIKSYTLFTYEAKVVSYVKEKLRHKDTYVRFLPKGYPIHAWIEIYGINVVIAINYKRAMSIVIQNKYVAESYRSYFNLLWKSASPN